MVGSAKGIGYTKILAYADCGGVLDFAVPGNGAGTLSVSVVVDAVLGTFAQEHASVRNQMADQFSPLHSASLVRTLTRHLGDRNGDLFPSDFLAGDPLFSEVAVGF